LHCKPLRAFRLPARVRRRKRFARQNLDGGRIHFAQAFQFPIQDSKTEAACDASRFCFGAGYGNRTRLLGLGSIVVIISLSLRNAWKAFIFRDFSVFLIPELLRIFANFCSFFKRIE